MPADSDLEAQGYFIATRSDGVKIPIQASALATEDGESISIDNPLPVAVTTEGSNETTLSATHIEDR